MGFLHRSQLTVSTPAASALVVPLSLVNSELGTSGIDTKLTRLIRAVSALFASPEGLDREWARQTWVELLPGRGGDTMLLSRWPIESISSITDGAGSTVTSSTYSIQGPRRDRVYRDSEWALNAVPIAPFSSVTGGAEPDYTVTYKAGWLPPGGTARGAGTLTTWAAATAYVSGEFVKSSTEGNNSLLLECTTAGTSDSTEPTWPSAAADTVTDNAATWTARTASELPDELQEAALIQVESLYRGDPKTGGNTKRERVGPIETEWFAAADQTALVPAVASILRMYR